MDTKTIQIGGENAALCKWPLRPGWEIASELTEVIGAALAALGGKQDFDLSKIDFAKLAEVIGKERIALVEKILVHGLQIVGKQHNPAQRLEWLNEHANFEDAMIALEEVLKHNLVFRSGALARLKNKSETSTASAQS